MLLQCPISSAWERVDRLRRTVGERPFLPESGASRCASPSAPAAWPQDGADLVVAPAQRRPAPAAGQARWQQPGDRARRLKHSRRRPTMCRCVLACFPIAPHFLAPMAGVTDTKPFRLSRHGRGTCRVRDDDHAVLTTKPPAHGSRRRRPGSAWRSRTSPSVMAEAAKYNVDHGAQLIDINMGCPAKKVCNA